LNVCRECSFKMIPMNAPNLRGEYIFKMVPREI
jgi:hypothetical protein